MLEKPLVHVSQTWKLDTDKSKNTLVVQILF